MPTEPTTTDPVAEARQWVADNPQAPGAIHVLRALTSAERYRLLAEHAQGDGGAGCKIVLGTLSNVLTITTTSQRTDHEIAEAIGRFLKLVEQVADDLSAQDPEPVPERPEPDGLRVASVGDHDLEAFREYVGLPVAVLVGSRAHIAACGALLDRRVMVSEEEWVLADAERHDSAVSTLMVPEDEQITPEEQRELDAMMDPLVSAKLRPGDPGYDEKFRLSLQPSRPDGSGEPA